MFGERILGLERQRDTIDKKQYAGDDIGRKQALDERGGDTSLAGAGGHLHEHLAPTQTYFAAKGIVAFLLIIAPGDTLVDGDAKWIDAHLTHGGAAFKVGLREKRLDRARVRFTLPIPEQDFLAVGEEDEGHTSLFSVVATLLSGIGGIDGLALGLNDGQPAPLAPAQHVIGAVAVR